MAQRVDKIAFGVDDLAIHLTFVPMAGSQQQRIEKTLAIADTIHELSHQVFSGGQYNCPLGTGQHIGLPHSFRNTARLRIAAGQDDDWYSV